MSTAHNSPSRETEILSKRLAQVEVLSSMGYWELDLESNQALWSNGLWQLLALDPSQNIPSPGLLAHFVHSEDLPLFEREFQQILKDRSPKFERKFRVVIDDGKTTRWLKERGEVELDSQGKPVRISAWVRDMTQEELVEAELKKTLHSLEVTSILLEHTGRMAKVGGWELDLSTGKVHMTLQTQVLHEIDENYTPLLYSTGSEWYPPEAWPTILAAVQDAIEFGKPYDLESPFITAKGRRIWVRVQGFPVVTNGKVTHLRGTFQDITERKQAEIEFSLSRESMGFGSWQFDPRTGALDWDNKMYSIYGVDKKDFTGAYDAWENTLSPAAKETAVRELNLA